VRNHAVLEIKCPNCSERLKLPDRAVEERVKCSSCEHTFVAESSQAAVLSVPAPSPPQVEPELVLFPVVERIPMRWSPLKIGAWIVLACLALGMLLLIVSQIDNLMRWSAYPNEKEDKDRYERISQRIEAERAKSSRNR
jgi:ribosomal protein S27E